MPKLTKLTKNFHRGRLGILSINFGQFTNHFLSEHDHSKLLILLASGQSGQLGHVLRYIPPPLRIKVADLWSIRILQKKLD